MSTEINLKNIKAYIQGNIRLYIPILVRKHIEEQIEVRINSSKKECIANGECVICGCSTPGLQMADKSCAGNCYPEMLSKKDWLKLKQGFIVNNWRLTNKKFICQTGIKE